MATSQLDALAGEEGILTFKFIVIGDAAVGKSSILLRYTQDHFKEEYQVTIGVEFGSKLVEVQPGTKVKLQIWDTAGQESFKSIVRSFYRNSIAVFLVYDVGNRKSFDSLNSWLDEVRNGADPGAILVLMGNKVDQAEMREVSYEDGQKFMKDNRIHFFFETSALDGTFIDKAFNEATKLAYMFYQRQQQNKNELASPLKKGQRLHNDSISTDKKIQSGGGCAC